jgi:hypothetical protein
MGGGKLVPAVGVGGVDGRRRARLEQLFRALPVALADRRHEGHHRLPTP